MRDFFSGEAGKYRVCGVGLFIALTAAISAWAADEPATPAPAAPAAPFQFFKPAAGQDISGKYWIKSYSAKIEPIGGGELPYKPEFMELYRKHQAAISASAEIIPEDQARKLCTPDGVPRVLENPYPFEIIQTEGQIHILYELNKIIRLIKMDKPLPDDMYLLTFPYYSGHSVGRWEGDTLIVQTGGFKDYTFLDNSGAPHSDQLRVTERYRKINNGKELEVIVDIHDPGVFTADWSTRFVYDARPDIKIMDWNCGEQHRDIKSVAGVVVPN